MTDQLKKILIVEDDDLITQMYQASLASSHFQVQMEKDGESGWKTVQSFMPDLVILDFMMPKLNGVEVLQKIRADERLKSIPVIVMSSLSAEADKKRALDAGATAYWVKNEVNMVEFEQKINEVLSQNTNNIPAQS